MRIPTWFTLLGVVCLGASALYSAENSSIFVDMGQGVYWMGLNNRPMEIAYQASDKVYYSHQGKQTIVEPPFGVSSMSLRDLNDHGQILVTFTDTCARSAIWDDGVYTAIGGCDTYAQGLNNLGQAFGYRRNETGSMQIFFWSNGVFSDIAPYMPFFTTYGFSYDTGYDINDSGQVVGQKGPDAFVWQDGKLTVLERPPGATTCGARAINKHGDIAGWCGLGSTQPSILWTKGGFRILPLPRDTQFCFAVSINSKGDLTGRGVVNGALEALVWLDGQAYVLNDRLSIPRWHFSTGMQINDRGLLWGFSNQNRIFVVDTNGL